MGLVHERDELLALRGTDTVLGFALRLYRRNQPPRLRAVGGTPDLRAGRLALGCRISGQERPPGIRVGKRERQTSRAWLSDWKLLPLPGLTPVSRAKEKPVVDERPDDVARRRAQGRLRRQYDRRINRGRAGCQISRSAGHAAV